MSWLERARHEAAQRGWAGSVPFPTDEMYRRGLPTVAFPDPDHAAGVQRWLADQLAAHEPQLACNRNVRLVQIHDILVGKGLVLAEIARHWDIAPDEVLAIGDSANDFSMLDGRLGFRCATTGNADEAIMDAVRLAGGYVARGRIGAGVVEALRHHADALGTLQLAL
jgi:hydroxymethylpyrimidine pyrophosphatase-like HAD family hydrolase